MPDSGKVLYLTFDDGPHEQATPFVLDQLKAWNAKGTFFCIGKNVQQHRDIYTRILDEGHAIGNHTQNHVNGWKTVDEKYIADINEAAKYIDSNLFRPPYGRISRFQANFLHNIARPAYRIIMWSVLSGDFDRKLKPERCLDNVLMNARPGSIVVFHDSTKAWDRMSFALPRVLEHFAGQGYVFKSL
ncbi:Peptidoglycan/xylan/chitin deacetylase, PgdA/CDA1 family [Filimonas lacunae]|uniref:Peptidoglycan/xylan/chitin deacetylase, PgdA/CDA1 family n=2 Tax=Filimonas lacunae TaxID=477680 RepID=A0A1N7KUL0_9BACT|nr:Peptidoglycan/xylan/chitin deacetylase, PgdA/CDA1 family [Filimonas lacunae]